MATFDWVMGRIEYEIVKHGGWAELHLDLLDEIAKHIPSYDDYVVE